MKKLITSMAIIAAVLSACSRTSGSFEERASAAEAEIGLGNYLQALAAYRSIEEDFRDDPRRAGILLREAHVHAAGLHDHGEAMKVYGRVIAEEPLSEAARIAREKRAELREQSGDYEGAIEDYSALLKLFGAEGENELHRVLVAGVYLSMRDFRQARVELKPLFKNPDVPASVLEKAVFLAAESYFLEGKSKRASGYYRWLLEEFPESPLAPEAKIHLATCYEEMGYLGVASAITDSAREEYPNERVVDAKMQSLRARGKSPSDKARLPASRGRTPEASGDGDQAPEKALDAGEKGLQTGDAPLASPRS